MNKVILIGRLTSDPEIINKENDLSVGRYTLAVDRRKKDSGTDFIRCVTFGKGAEFASKYLSKGTKICVAGRIQTGSYKNKDGATVYTTDVVVDEHEFCEAKKSVVSTPAVGDGFKNIPEGLDDELPFN